MRSPFAAGPGAKLDLKRPKEPLENFPLGSLHLVGIITRGDQAWGLITAPDGKLYQVTAGDHLGQNQGRVIAVQKSHLDLVESIATGDSWRDQAIKLVLWSPVSESPLQSAKAK